MSPAVGVWARSIGSWSLDGYSSPLYDDILGSSNHSINVLAAITEGRAIGIALANPLYGLQNYDSIQLVAHSAGSALINGLTSSLRLQGYRGAIQNTFLDPAVPTIVDQAILGICATSVENYYTDSLVVPFGTDPGDEHGIDFGTFSNSGKVTFETGSRTNIFYSTVNNLAGGVFELQGDALLTNPNGSNGIFSNAGILGGSGIIGMSFSNSGKIMPGLDLGIAKLQVNGNLNLASTSVLAFQINGIVQGTSYDFLFVQGAVSLNGKLDLSFLPDFNLNTIPVNATFTLVTSGSFTGAFSNIVSGQRLATGDGLGSFLVTYDGNELVASHFQAIPEPQTWLLLGAGSICLGLT